MSNKLSKTNIKLRPYQTRKVEQAAQILIRKGAVYIAGEVRTGKTLIALSLAAKIFGPKDQVLFITKKKAMPSIERDYKNGKFKFDMLTVSMDSLHNVEGDPDLIIVDEAHSFGTFPKPNLRAKTLRKMFFPKKLPHGRGANRPYVIFLSGTPSPESYAQLFPQFWAIRLGPWRKYVNFYSWAKDYVRITEQYIGNLRPVKNYSKVKSKRKVLEEFKPWSVSLTQKEAGFNGEVKEKIIHVPAPRLIHERIERLPLQKINTGKFKLLPTAAQIMIGAHQIASGTYIQHTKEGKELEIISDYKRSYIAEKFRGKKVAIFYIYVAEGELLKSYFSWTDNPAHFNKTGKGVKFICQVTSGSMGTDLHTADYIIFFNIAHSATQYWQARARSQTIDGGDKKVIWLFSDTGIEDDIYQVVVGKKNYTAKHFDNWLHEVKNKKNKTTRKHSVGKRHAG